MKYRGVAFPFLTAGGNMALILDHFSFRYDGAEREALQDIALKIDHGEFVVLVRQRQIHASAKCKRDHSGLP